MSISAVNLTYVGQGATAGGQEIANYGPGPLAKEVVGYGTATLDGSSTSFVVNFIDGNQNLAQTPKILQLLSATAASGGNTILTTSGPATQVALGTSITTAGFTNSANNGTFTVKAVSTNTITVNNGSAVAETNPSATLTYQYGPAILGVSVSRMGASTDTAAASTTVYPSNNLTNATVTLNISAAGSNAQLLSFLMRIIFAS